mgnify:FL=1
MVCNTLALFLLLFLFLFERGFLVGGAMVGEGEAPLAEELRRFLVQRRVQIDDGLQRRQRREELLEVVQRNVLLQSLTVSNMQHQARKTKTDFVQRIGLAEQLDGFERRGERAARENQTQQQQNRLLARIQRTCVQQQAVSNATSNRASKRQVCALFESGSAAAGALPGSTIGGSVCPGCGLAGDWLETASLRSRPGWCASP